MKKMFSLLFCCFLSFSFINADESSDSPRFYTDETQVSIDDPSQYAAQMRALATIADENQGSNNVYFHRIKKIDVENRDVFLVDESKWDIGWWYKETIVDWEVGDRLAISFTASFNGFGIQNLDKGSLAWASIWRFNLPAPENSDSVVEVTNDDPNYSSIITLKSGFQFGIPTFWLFARTFNVGDAVFVFLERDSHTVANMMNGNIARSSTLITVGNSDWRKDAQ